MTVQVNIYEAKTNLSRLVEQVLAGERVVIARNGKPVVDLVRHQGSTVRFGGAGEPAPGSRTTPPFISPRSPLPS